MWSAPQRASRRRLTMPVRYAARPKCMPLDPAIRVLSRSKNAAARSSDGAAGNSATPATPGSTLASVDFEDDGIALAAAGTDRGAADPAAPPAQFVDKGPDNPRA